MTFYHNDPEDEDEPTPQVDDGPLDNWGSW
jgi:hypothetical protein